jgi:hypothetical protein
LSTRLLVVRVVIGLKRAVEAIGVRRQADIYVDCVADWRYPAFLLRSLRRCGRPVLEVPARDAIMAWGADGFRNFVFRTRLLPERTEPTAPVVVTRDPERLGGTARSRVRVSIDWFSSDARAAGLVMPYFPHRDFWSHEPEPGLLVSGQRRFRIGFAGSTGDETYGEAFAFPMLGRTEVLGEIRARFEDRVAIVHTRAELAALDPATAPITLVTAPGRRHVPTTHVLRGGEYVDFLGSCTFFVAPPGFRMPVCHNLVEAMSLRAIPILNYADWLEPRLQDGVDCLSFSTRADLASAITRALAMADDEVARLRHGVATYYDEHLSVDSFARRLCPVLEDSPTIVVNAERETVALWRKRQLETQ